MDTGRPDGDSSSQSDSRIVRIRKEGAAGEVVRIDLQDGSSFFLPILSLHDEWLEEGRVLSDEERARVAFLAECYAARRKALDLLALREQPRFRLEAKLRSRGFSVQAARGSLDELEAEGSLDDLRFAELWISGKQRRNPCGRARLYAGLLNQGVSRRVAEEALRDWGGEQEEEALELAAARVVARRGVDREKALRALARKGFSLPSIKKYLDGLGEEAFDVG